MRRAVLVALAACGSAPGKLLTPSSPRSSLAAPHETILVEQGSSLVRVALDTGDATPVGTIPIALTDDGAYRLDVIAEHYVIGDRDGAQHRLDALQPVGRPMLSPTQTLVVIDQPAAGQEVGPFTMTRVAVVTLADASVKLFELGPFDTVEWSADAAALYVARGDSWKRLELATGAITELRGRPPGTDTFERRSFQRPATCPARGLSLSITSDGERQRIVAETHANQGDPDHLARIEPRVLVEARYVKRDLVQHATGGPALGDLMFTKTCSHAVFTFGDAVYLLDLDSGRYGPVTRGARPR